jgi:predicted enzyme related to lactoylglutathione lyase
MLKIYGQDVAALHRLSLQEAKNGVPPRWFLYVASDNVDQIAKFTTALGGTVVAGPFDVMTAGRMAIVQDPTGATFGVW